MRLKGYTQRDVLQADVQKAYAGALGQMGANGGGSGSGMLGDIAGLGVTLGAMSGVIGMTKDAMAPMMNMGAVVAAPVAPATAGGWDCACGAKNIQSKFCPECGSKKPEPKVTETWDCPNCGNKYITAKFCGECGCKKPEVPAAWDCPNCGNKGITAKFCGECGCCKPEPKVTWDCPECGNKDITAKFCPECGHKRG
jgi:ribosomal protein L32